MSPEVPASQATKVEAALGAHDQVVRSSLLRPQDQRPWASSVARGSVRQAAVGCMPHQAATHGGCTAEPSLGVWHHPSQGLAQDRRK